MRLATFLVTALALSLSACSPADPEDTPEQPTSHLEFTPAGTDPGTELDLGDKATLVWQPETSLTGVLDLSVDAVAEERPSVFDGWVRDDVMAASRPYFVSVTLRNTGEADLTGQDVPLYLRDENGTLGAPWTLGGDFTACQSGPLPSPFTSGTKAEMCLVYLVPDGARIQDLVFEPTEGYDPITWSGEVQEPAKKVSSRAKKQDRKRG